MPRAENSPPPKARPAPMPMGTPDLRAMADALPALFAFIDAEEHILFASAAFERWFGIRAEELRGAALRELIGPEAYRAIEGPLRQALAGVPSEYEAPIPHADGGTRIVHAVHGPHVAADGSVVGFCLLMLDVTRRHRLDALRSDKAAILAQIATGSPLAEVLTALVCMIERQAEGMLGSVLLLDETGTRLRHGAAVSLPPAYVKAIDGMRIGPDRGSCGTAAWSARRIVVEDTLTDPRWADFRDLAREHGLRACWSEPIRSTAGAVLGTFALYYRRPRRPDAGQAQLIETAAHLAGIAIERARAGEEVEARARERTAQLARANETLMLQQAELAQAARLSSMVVMAASLSHELNQPLQAIVNYARSCDMELQAEGPDVAVVKDDLREIAGQANRAAEIIRQLRTVVREEPAPRVETDVNRVVRQVAESLRPRAHRRRVSLHTLLAENLPTLWARPLEIEQALLSVAQNGIEAMAAVPEAGRRLEITTQSAGEGAVEILVRDTGPGVPTGMTEVIFTPFYTTKTAGMGVGLSLARRLAERQNGSISVAQAGPGGAEFRIRLCPIDPDESAER